MSRLTIIELVISAVGLAVGLGGFILTGQAAKAPDAPKEKKRNHRLFLALTVISAWFLVGTAITAVSRSGGGMAVEFDMFSPRVTLLGFSFAKTTVLTWALIGIVLVFAIIFRLFIFPHFDPDSPRGIQNILELSVEAMQNFTKGVLGDYSDQIAPYMYSLAVFMVLSAASELFGCRPPTSDIIVTMSMGLITFVLINYFGIRKRGLSGRLKSFCKPVPIIFPMKILSEIATPISLACRLFGNMIGGMIVMDLLKSVLGGYASGVPAVAGLYFNLFHPLIQTYIFIILSLTFINEAIE